MSSYKRAAEEARSILPGSVTVVVAAVAVKSSARSTLRRMRASLSVLVVRPPRPAAEQIVLVLRHTLGRPVTAFPWLVVVVAVAMAQIHQTSDKTLAAVVAAVEGEPPLTQPLRQWLTQLRDMTVRTMAEVAERLPMDRVRRVAQAAT